MQKIYMLTAVDVRRAEKEGTSRATSISKLTIPPIKFATAGHNPGGGVMATDFNLPRIEALEPKFMVKGLDTEIFGGLGEVDRWVFAGAYKNKKTGLGIMAWKTDWSVVIDGNDISSQMSNYLETITVTDKAGASSDSCSLRMDDTGGAIRLPQPGGSVLVRLNGVQVFAGIIDSVKSSGSRSSGRSLSVSAKGFDVSGKAKEPQRIHQDEGTVGGFLKTVAKKAGFDMKIDPALGNIVRDYIAADGESLLHLGEKLARELGGTFKLRENIAVLAKHGGEFGLPLITGLFNTGGSGDLISWDIEPVSTRPVFKEIAVPYFDRKKGLPMDFRTESGAAGEKARAVNLVRSIARDENHAREIAEGRKQQIEREGGKGRVTLNLTPEAQAEALFQLRGTRAGVDGTYRIVGVTHKASRSGGATTDLDLQQPQDGAGTDGR